jgi:hypothetical protein
VGEKLGLEDTGEQRVRLLSTDNQREPVILQVRGADSLNGANWDSTFRRDDKLVVDDTLGHEIDMTVGLESVSGDTKP